MVQYERHQKLLAYLEKKRTATVRELSELLFTSEASIRRDIAALEEKGRVKRVYGGVITPDYINGVIPLDLRDNRNGSVKDMIAERAAALLFDGATVMLDASSTARRIMKYIEHFHDLKIITNNIRILNECGSENASIWGTGGFCDNKNHAFVGPMAERFVETLSADIFFFSSQGITEDGEITDASEEETALRRAMLSRAKRRVFLCDSSKIGVRHMFTLCKKEDVTDIICDVKLPWEK